MKRILQRIFLACTATCLLQAPAQAWDGAATGKISVIQMTGGLNFDVRVYLTGGGPMWGDGSPDWAYLNHDYDNHQAVVSLLMTAWSLNKDVLIYTNKNGNYCQIGWVQAS